MATADQIDAAAAAGRHRKPVTSDTLMSASHSLGGAAEPLPAWQTDLAARYVDREAPEVAEILALPVPARDAPADALVAFYAGDGPRGVRRWATTASRASIAAARRVLRERRALREGR